MSKGRWVLFKSRHGSFVIPETKLANPRVQLLFRNKDIKIMATVPSFLKKTRKPARIIKPIRVGRVTQPVKLPVSRPIRPAGTLRYRPKRRRPSRRQKLSGIEMKHLRDLPGKFGITTFDTHAYIDKTLTYQENRTQIERKLKNIARIDMPAEEFTPERFQSDLETHIENLKFRAEAGDIHATRELRMWERERGRVRVV